MTRLHHNVGQCSDDPAHTVAELVTDLEDNNLFITASKNEQHILRYILHTGATTIIVLGLDVMNVC